MRKSAAARKLQNAPLHTQKDYVCLVEVMHQTLVLLVSNALLAALLQSTGLQSFATAPKHIGCKSHCGVHQDNGNLQPAPLFMRTQDQLQAVKHTPKATLYPEAVGEEQQP